LGLPTGLRDRPRQYDRNPARCQRMIVSGRRIAIALRTGREPTIEPNKQKAICIAEFRELFEAVQRRLTEQRTHHVTTRTKNDAPLKGILFDAAGDPMVPTHATKRGVRYRYYVSQPYLRGLATPPIGAIVRVPAPDIEAVVSKALKEYLAQSN